MLVFLALMVLTGLSIQTTHIVSQLNPFSQQYLYAKTKPIMVSDKCNQHNESLHKLSKLDFKTFRTYYTITKVKTLENLLSRRPLNL